MSKTLNEELIQKRLEDKGWSVPHETHQEDKISKLRNEYDFEIISDWDKCDAYFYSDETRDGYEIWIATEQEGNVCINEDVYYYQDNWFEKLADYLRDGCTVYIDSYTQDEYGFEEVIEALYEELYIEIYDDMEEILIGEGYEYEKQ
tara:strand:- start:41 stop:481 length:441 start_codon:yes stop_codon:yes gene_type:complete